MNWSTDMRAVAEAESCAWLAGGHGAYPQCCAAEGGCQDHPLHAGVASAQVSQSKTYMGVSYRWISLEMTLEHWHWKQVNNSDIEK